MKQKEDEKQRARRYWILPKKIIKHSYMYIYIYIYNSKPFLFWRRFQPRTLLIRVTDMWNVEFRFETSLVLGQLGLALGLTNRGRLLN